MTATVQAAASVYVSRTDPLGSCQASQALSRLTTWVSGKPTVTRTTPAKPLLNKLRLTRVRVARVQHYKDPVV